MHRVSFAMLAALAAACRSPSTSPAQSAGPPAQLVPEPANESDLIVAHVNDRPVYGSCVAAQARAHHLDAKAALAECIDFELLAQAADARGIARDPEIAYATKTALVARLVETAFEDGLQKPADLGSDWDDFVTKNTWHYKHQEYRKSTYVRIPVDAKAPPADDAKAHALADQIAAAAAPETGLMSPDLRAIAEKIVPLVECNDTVKTPCYADVPAYRVMALEEHYGTALFALPEIGRTSQAVRTKWGWDVIAWVGSVPETNPSADEVFAKLLPEYKATRFFGAWVRQIQHERNVRVFVEPTAEASLGTLP